MNTNNPTRSAMQAMDSAIEPEKIAAAEYEDKRGSLAKATEIFRAGLVAGEITQSRLNDAKSYVRNALERAWSQVSDMLLKGGRSEFHDDLYWKSLYRPELHRLSSAIKLADAAKSGNPDEAAAIAKAKAILAAFQPYANAAELLKGMIVKRVVKSEAEKRVEKLVPKTAKSADVLAAVNKVIEQQRPDLVTRFISIQRKTLVRLSEKYKPGLRLRMSGDDKQAFGAISRNLKPGIQYSYDCESTLERLEGALQVATGMNRLGVSKQIAEALEVINTPRVLDEAELLKSANAYVDEAFDFVRAKMMEKAGEMSSPEVEDMSGAEFVLSGMVHGKTVTIRQSIILNVSVNGKVFNQYPARITLGGRAVSEADYKTFMTKGA